MEKHDLGAVICFVGENVRYITGVFQGNWKNNIFIRYCVLPRGGDPVLFETAGLGSRMRANRRALAERQHPARDHVEVGGDRRGDDGRQDGRIDRAGAARERRRERADRDRYRTTRRAAAAFQRAKLNIVSAWPACRVHASSRRRTRSSASRSRARAAIRRSGRSSTSGSSRACKESTITAKVNEYLYENGFDFVYDIIVASGGNTSPYRRWHTDKVIREGDLVIVDQNAVGPGGYFVDFVRCFKVGGRLDPEGEGPLQGVLRVDVRGDRADEGRQHDRRRRRASSRRTPTTSSAR